MNQQEKWEEIKWHQYDTEDDKERPDLICAGCKSKDCSDCLVIMGDSISDFYRSKFIERK